MPEETKSPEELKLISLRAELMVEHKYMEDLRLASEREKVKQLYGTTIENEMERTRKRIAELNSEIRATERKIAEWEEKLKKVV